MSPTIMDHKIILKCRVCLDEFDEDTMLDLFKESVPLNVSKSKQRNLKLHKKVEYCCGVKIRDSPDLPSKICTKCFEMTRMWYNFRQMCVNTQVYLESLCVDRTRPEGFDDAEYLEYLTEDLQTFRVKTHDRDEDALNDSTKEGSAFDSEDDTDLNNDEFDDDDDDDDDELPFDPTQPDTCLENMIVKIKEENDSNGPHEQSDGHGMRTRAKSEQIARGSDQREKSRSESSNSPSKSAEGMKRLFRPPSPTTFMCSICGNVYNKKASFVYHMSLHNNVKPHECELCGKAFRQLCELKNHMRRHTGEKPYKCSFCDRHFIDRSEKHRHERVHTNTRPYICSVCGKSFMYSAILKNHSKLHTGRKDFSCMVCQKAFTLQHQLKAHLQTITHKQKEAQFVSAGYEVVYE